MLVQAIRPNRCGWSWAILPGGLATFLADWWRTIYRRTWVSSLLLRIALVPRGRSLRRRWRACHLMVMFCIWPRRGILPWRVACSVRDCPITLSEISPTSPCWSRCRSCLWFIPRCPQRTCKNLSPMPRPCPSSSITRRLAVALLRTLLLRPLIWRAASRWRT